MDSSDLIFALLPYSLNGFYPFSMSHYYLIFIHSLKAHEEFLGLLFPGLLALHLSLDNFVHPWPQLQWVGANS